MRPQLPGAGSRTRTGTPNWALAPQANESTNSTIPAYKQLIYVLMELPTTHSYDKFNDIERRVNQVAGYLLSVVA